MTNILEEFGLSIKESDAPDRMPIDFSIEDAEDNVAWVWGDFRGVDWECNHPLQCVEFDNDEPVGECLLCGSHCDYCWTKEIVDEGHDDDGNYYAHEGDVREIVNWYPRREVGGAIAKILEEMKGEKK